MPQTRSTSIDKVLLPAMTALISDQLLKHSDLDVKISVVACITEITRITAPDAPYNDDQMKVHHTNEHSKDHYNELYIIRIIKV